MSKQSALVLSYLDVSAEDIALVGKDGLTISELAHAKFIIPDGFFISSRAYFQFLKENNLPTKIKHLLATVDFTRPESLLEASILIKKFFLEGKMPNELVSEVYQAYKQLNGSLSEKAVILQTSVVVEHEMSLELTGFSDSEVRTLGDANMLLKIKELWSSFFEAKAIYYRQQKKISHFTTGMAIIVQKTIAADKSGWIYTVEPETGNKNKLVIEAMWGLPNKQTTSDYYEVSKKDGLITKKLKSLQTSAEQLKGNKIKNISLNSKEASKSKLTEKEIQAFVNLVKHFERFHYFPVEICWAIEKKKAYILKIKPITTKAALESENKINNLQILSLGKALSPGIVTGRLKLVRTFKDLQQLEKSDIMLTRELKPEYFPFLKLISGLILEDDKLNGFIRLFSRNKLIPAVFGVKNATQIAKNNHIVTINGTKGEIYKGGYLREKSFRFLDSMPTATKIYATLNEFDDSIKAALEKVDSVVVPGELLVKSIGVHPKSFIKQKRGAEYSNLLREQLEPIIRSNYPLSVIYSLSNLQTNEYRSLRNGKEYEPIEPNPLLGYHGALRFIYDNEILELELQAIQTLRNKHNLKNISIMIPYVRTTSEVVEIKSLMQTLKLSRSPTLKLWLQISIPANIFILEQFMDCGIDGISIDSDSLTSLMLGTDDRNDEVMALVNPLDPSLLITYEKIIKAAQTRNILTTITGSAINHYPELTEKLIHYGISSISASPDSLSHLKEIIADSERRFMIQKINPKVLTDSHLKSTL